MHTYTYLGLLCERALELGTYLGLLRERALELGELKHLLVEERLVALRAVLRQLGALLQLRQLQLVLLLLAAARRVTHRLQSADRQKRFIEKHC